MQELFIYLNQVYSILSSKKDTYNIEQEKISYNSIIRYIKSIR